MLSVNLLTPELHGRAIRDECAEPVWQPVPGGTFPVAQAGRAATCYQETVKLILVGELLRSVNLR